MDRNSHLPIYIVQSLLIHAGLLLAAGYLMPIHKLSDIRSTLPLELLEVTEVEYVPPPSQPAPEPPPAKKVPKKVSISKPVAADRKTSRVQPPVTPPAEAKIETPPKTAGKSLAPGQSPLSGLDLDKSHETSPSAKSEKSSTNPRVSYSRSSPFSEMPSPKPVISNQNPEEKVQIAFNESEKSSPYMQPQPNAAREIPSPEPSAVPQGEIEIPAGDNWDGNYPLHDKPGIIPDATISDLSASLKIDAGANPSHQDADKQPMGRMESGSGIKPEKFPALPSAEEKMQIAAFNEPEKSGSYIQPQPDTAREISAPELPAPPQGETALPAGDNGVRDYPPHDRPAVTEALAASRSPASAPGTAISDLSASLKINAEAVPTHQNTDKQTVTSGSNVYSAKKETSYRPAAQVAGIKKPGRIVNKLSIPSASASSLSGRILSTPGKDAAASPDLPPRITLEQETETAQDNQETLTVEDQMFDLKGQINAGVETAFLSLNDQTQQLDLSSGKFSAKVKLRLGVNNLKVSAIDSSGRYTSKGVTVNYTPLDISYSGDWTIYVNDALPESQYIYAVTGDRYGNKWFGLAGGVARFNGSSWIKYTVLDGLAGYHVRALAEDTRGGMWFGTEKGISHFNGSRWTTEKIPAGMINTIACGPDGKVWAGTQEGLFMFDGTTWRHFTEKDGLPHNQVNALALDKSGNLWVGTPSGAAMYDGQSWKVFTVKDGLSHDAIYAIACDIKGKLWFGTEYGASCFDGQNWARYTMEDGLSDNQVNAISIDKANNAWFGTDNGVSRLSKDTWAQFNQANGLASDQVNTVLAESNDRIWFGTSRGVTELNTRYAGHTTHR